MLSTHIKLTLLGPILLAPFPCRAVTLQLELWTREEPATKAEAILHATPIVVTADREVGKLRTPVEAPGTAKITLPEGKSWRIEVETPEYWSQPTVVTTAPGSDPLARIELYPTGSVSGRIDLLGAKEEPPPEVYVHFSSRRTGDATGFRGSTKCPVESGGWACRVPIGALDLRLQIPGFISHFLWSQSVEASKALDLGELSFVRGASLGGFVRTEDESPVTEKCCTVSLRPQDGGTVASGSRVSRRKASGKSMSKHEIRRYFAAFGMST